MIKVNLLYNRAITTVDVQSARPGAAGPVGSVDDFQLDAGFNTFEYSQSAQLIKLLLLISFLVPLVIFEKIRNDQDRVLIIEKRSDVESLNGLKLKKEEELKAYKGVKATKRALTSRDNELRAVKADRLMAVQSVDALQSAVPEDVWLLNVEFKTGFMQIRGQTLVETGLDNFAQNLKNVQGFSNINIPKDVKVKSPTGRTVNEFLVTLTIEDGFTEPEGVL